MTSQEFVPDVFNYTLLNRLCQAYGPSGSEEEVAAIIKAEVVPYCDKLVSDSMGNLIASRNGSGKKVMVAAHMDEIALMVTYIDESGFLRFIVIGEIEARYLPYRRVILQNGKMGTIGLERLEKSTEIDLSKLYIDIGASSRAEAEQVVGIGDALILEGAYVEVGKRIMSKALDGRIGCFVAIEALKRTKSTNELAFAFTVQEEVAMRGARVAAYAISPDLALVVDVTRTGDTPGAARMEVSLGAGVGIKAFDHSLVTPPNIKRWMSATADRYSIPCQLEVLEQGGTDAGVIQLTKGGIPSGVLSIPARQVHTPTEVVDKQDMEAAVTLLTKLLEENEDL
ncbi:putative aminopeptidase YsdC [Peptococcaceae bacterium CEB3]|nr:putative aminopeptidase YsdC [Peptococcaceae bacterium CEB3]